MSKRPRFESHGDEPESHRLSKESAQPKQHLYLVVDDWERGYSVHRVGEEDFGSDVPGARPATSPLVRIQAQHLHSWSFAAHGTKILAMQPPKHCPGIPVFDTRTLGVTACPYPQSRGDLGSKPVTSGGPGPASSRRRSSVVSGYAAHPDERTVFVSVRDWRPGIGKIYVHASRRSTFTFDMERLEWSHAGEWLPPFKGRAHYDRELDAWVGLCLYSEGAGRVCCCDVPPAAGAGSETMTMPAWKLGQDVFFGAPAGPVGHLSATLVYMGGDSRFCMVVTREADARIGGYKYSSRGRVVEMTCFVLKYDKEGDLCTTSRRAYASLTYEVAHEGIDGTQNPVAFWM
ncbi:hypothetical protein BAE44_0001632 [Dichanthelium oligosanthes]|uniref:DUF1618 domain-containing protein n=1 Tax=Dichanthelium oligosanthes TaxID=888268 RepID=A0A1E5WIW7_9POAL|nr:hypothetical protein BAE44_0001632 [Dichanthelium oligosanthes]